MNTDKELDIDANEIRRNAANSIECGAVTEDYPLDLDLAYELLNNALASEILCVLRYRHHQITAKGIDFPQVAAEFKEHAESESEHMLMIAERIDQLGGDPDFSTENLTKRAATQFGSATDLYTMIKDDLVAERVVIEVYRKMIKWFGDADPTTRRMLEHILEEEEDHANDLSDLLEGMAPPASKALHS